MKTKIASAISKILFYLCVMIGSVQGFAQDEMQGGSQEVPMEGDTRGVDNVPPKRDALSAWGRYFGRELPDPLDADQMSEYQKNKADFDKRAQAGADFTQAATSVVAAGTPSPTVVSTAGTMVVSEAAGAVVEGETSEKPGVLGKIWNGIKSFVSWINPFD